MGRHECPDDCKQHKICIGERCQCRRYDGRSTACYACKLAKTACRPGVAGMCERCLKKAGPHRCNKRGDGNPREGVPAGPQRPRYHMDFGPSAGEALSGAAMKSSSPIYQQPTPPESPRSVSVKASPVLLPDPIVPLGAPTPVPLVPTLAPVVTTSAPVAPEFVPFAPAFAPVTPVITPVAMALALNCDCIFGLAMAKAAISQHLPEHNPEFLIFDLAPDATQVPFVLSAGQHLLDALINVGSCPRCLKQSMKSRPYDVYLAIAMGVKVFWRCVLPYASRLAPEVQSNTLRLLRSLDNFAGRFGASKPVEKISEKITQMIWALEEAPQQALPYV